MRDTTESTLAYLSLTPEDILHSMEAIGVRCDGRLLALNSYENRVYQIVTEDKANVVAKFYRPGRWSDDAILEDHEFSIELAADEIPVLPPIDLRSIALAIPTAPQGRRAACVHG